MSPVGLNYGEGPDISPMSGTVEFKEGVTSAMFMLSVIDDEVSCSVLCCFQCQQYRLTRKLCYRKDDRAMRPVQGGPKKLHTAFFAITLPTLNHFS